MVNDIDISKRTRNFPPAPVVPLRDTDPRGNSIASRPIDCHLRRSSIGRFDRDVGAATREIPLRRTIGTTRFVVRRLQVSEGARRFNETRESVSSGNRIRRRRRRP